MGRASKKTIQIIESENKKHHLTKKELERLKQSYVKIGEKEFYPPDCVKSNPVALQKWTDIMELYKTCDHVDIVTSADIGLLERYSLMYADYQLLLEAKQEAKETAKTPLEFSYICNEHKLDSKISTQAKLLLSMETELFLTPLSKSRAMPRKPLKQKEESNLKSKGFKLK